MCNKPLRFIWDVKLVTVGGEVVLQTQMSRVYLPLDPKNRPRVVTDPKFAVVTDQVSYRYQRSGRVLFHLQRSRDGIYR